MQTRDKGLRDVMLSGRPVAPGEDLIGTRSSRVTAQSPQRTRRQWLRAMSDRHSELARGAFVIRQSMNVRLQALERQGDSLSAQHRHPSAGPCRPS